MATFDVAHINEQGQNIIIVIVGRQVMQSECDALQRCASSAGLAGVVVPVWPDFMGGFGFLAPMQWMSYFQSLDWNFICMNVNGTLTCG